MKFMNFNYKDTYNYFTLFIFYMHKYNLKVII